METFSPLVAFVLVVICIVAAAFFGWQQFQTLKRLRLQPEMPVEDRTYFRRQAIRRLIGCGLLVAIGALIGGSYVSGQEEWVDRLGQPDPAKVAPGVAPDPELQHKKRLYVWYWIAVLMLLLALVIVAAIDFFAIRGYGARHLKRIYSDRKAMLEQELAELKRARGYRNGEMP